MHVSSCLWTGDLLDQLDLDEQVKSEHQAMQSHHYRRILDEGKIYSQPFSEDLPRQLALRLSGQPP